MKLDVTELLQIEAHAVAGLHEFAGDDAPGYHYIAAQQRAANRSEMLGEPGERVERMAHAIRPAAFSDLDSIDGRDASHCSKVNRAPVLHWRT